MKFTVLVTFGVVLYIAVVAGLPLQDQDDPDWWKNAIFYQIYPRSFKDSNNDGIGDLKGITSKLEYIKDTGITAAWLSPIYKSPMVDAGYDISDYRAIQPEYGTMEDFEELIQKAIELGLKIVMDFVPNHTSDEHEWFEKSANRVPGYENYYIWLDGRENNTKPPNNWVSYFHGPAWHYHEVRGQWYLHQFAKQQPDLNFRDPRLVQEIKDVMKFWLDKGVAGFRVDTIPSLVEKEGYPDEPLSNDPNSTPEDHGHLQHPYTNDQPETYDMVYQWRELLDSYKGSTRVMMTEAYSEIHKVMGYYGNGTSEGAHFTFNFLFITELNEKSTAQDIALTIQKWLTYMPSGHVANWVLGNHDQHRVATRYGVAKADGLNMLHFFLPGVKVVYNGEEIGMEDGEVTFEEGNDPQGCNAGPDRYQWFTRDPERTPFHWDDSVNAGFNEGAETWLPVSEKYKENNLAAQMNQTGLDSHYLVFKKALKLKSHPTFINGDLTIKALNERVLLMKRDLEGFETFIYAFNIGNKMETVDLRILGKIPSKITYEIASVGAVGKIGTETESNNLILHPNEAYVLVTKIN